MILLGIASRRSASIYEQELKAHADRGKLEKIKINRKLLSKITNTNKRI